MLGLGLDLIGTAFRNMAGPSQTTIPLAPANTVPPAILGTPEIGATLGTDGGTWDGSPAPALSYRWRRDGADIAGASAASYLLSPADDGAAITVLVTATNASGTDAAASAAVTALRPAPAAQGALPDVNYALGTGIRSVDAAADFTGAAGGAWSLSAAPAGVTIDQAGQVAIPTDIALAAESVVVAYANSGGTAQSGFSVTVSEAVNQPPSGGDVTLRFEVAAGAGGDAVPPVILSMSPAAGSTGAATTGALTLSFSEPVSFGAGRIALREAAHGIELEGFDVQADAGAGPGKVSVSGATLTVEPALPLPHGATVALRLDPGAVADAAGTPHAGVADDTTLAFATAGSGVANLLPAGAAGFDDPSGWIAEGTWTVAGGEASRTTTALQEVLEHDVAIPAGPAIVSYDILSTNGLTGLKLQLGSPFLNTGINHNKAWPVATLVESAGHGRVRFAASNGWAGRLDDVRAYPVGALRALPAEIYGLWGQSNIVGTGAEGPEPGRDPHHPLIEYLAASAQSTMGADPDALSAGIDPLQHDVTFNAGVGPGMTFARTLLAGLAPGRRIVLVACGSPSTGLVGPGAAWAPGGTSYALALAQMGKALAACPAGSAFRGVLWSQGENDNSETVGTDYPPAFAAMAAAVRADLGAPELAFAILGPTPENDPGGRLAAAQASLDQDGGANAVAGVKFVPGPAGHALPGDPGHFTAHGHRLRGAAGARAMAMAHQPPMGAQAAFLDLSTAASLFTASGAVTSPGIAAASGRTAVGVFLYGGQLPRAGSVTIGGVAATKRLAMAFDQVELSVWDAEVPAGNSGAVSVASSTGAIADMAVSAWDVAGLAYLSGTTGGGKVAATSFDLVTAAPAGGSVMALAGTNAAWSFGFSGAAETHDAQVDGRGQAGALAAPAAGGDTITVTTPSNFADLALLAAVYG